MKKKLVLSIAALGLLGTLLWLVASRGGAEAESRYEFAELTRGDLENVVSSTGTLSAVGTVQVGTQVSGIIAHVYVDFNDEVRRGQLLAVLDTTLLAANVRDAEAGLLRAQAQYRQAQNDHRRNREMFDKNLISELQYTASETNLETAYAALQTARAALQRARTNLKYAFIRSPISGRVISRSIERGQTVAASLSAPTLFTIAEDLSRMEIHASVDESDIGQIQEGMKVRFDVQAYPDEIFYGTVRQIRLQPTTIQNVVNYTVVIDAENKDNRLLPGMTATVDFLVEQREDVLLVPNAALRFQPTAEMLQQFRELRRKRFEALPDSVKERRRRRFDAFGDGAQAGNGQGLRAFFGRNMPKDVGRVWYLNEEGELSVSLLRTGATDGKMTEVVRSRALKEGMKVIVAVREAESKERSSSNRRASSVFRRRPF